MFTQSQLPAWHSALSTSYVIPAVLLNPILFLHSVNALLSRILPPTISTTTAIQYLPYYPLGPSAEHPHLDIHASDSLCWSYTILMVCAQLVAFGRVSVAREERKEKARQTRREIRPGHSRRSSPQSCKGGEGRPGYSRSSSYQSQRPPGLSRAQSYQTERPGYSRAQSYNKASERPGYSQSQSHASYVEDVRLEYSRNQSYTSGMVPTLNGYAKAGSGTVPTLSGFAKEESTDNTLLMERVAAALKENEEQAQREREEMGEESDGFEDEEIMDFTATESTEEEEEELIIR